MSAFGFLNYWRFSPSLMGLVDLFMNGVRFQGGVVILVDERIRVAWRIVW
jgi:hypothetical protein